MLKRLTIIMAGIILSSTVAFALTMEEQQSVQKAADTYLSGLRHSASVLATLSATISPLCNTGHLGIPAPIRNVEKSRKQGSTAAFPPF